MPTRTLIGFATAALIVFATAAALGIVGRVCLPKSHAAGDVQKPAALAAATSLTAELAVDEPDDPVFPAGTELAEPIVRPELDPKPAPVAEIVRSGAEGVRLAAAAPRVSANGVDEPSAPSLAIEPDLAERLAAPSLLRLATPSLPRMVAGPAWPGLGPASNCPQARADDRPGPSWSRAG